MSTNAKKSKKQHTLFIKNLKRTYIRACLNYREDFIKVMACMLCLGASLFALLLAFEPELNGQQRFLTIGIMACTIISGLTFPRITAYVIGAWVIISRTYIYQTFSIQGVIIGYVVIASLFALLFVIGRLLGALLAVLIFGKASEHGSRRITTQDVICFVLYSAFVLAIYGMIALSSMMYHCNCG